MSLLKAGTGRVLLAGAAGLALMTSGCGGGGNSTQTQVPITVSLAVSTIVAPQDGTMVIVPINITSTSETALVSLSGLPAGVAEQYAASDTNPSGQIKITASASAPAGTYTPSVTVTSAGQTVSTSFTLVVAVVAKVSTALDTTLGVGGQLEQFMTTSLQLGGWTADYFGTGAAAAAREATLNQLGPQHIRVQVVTGAIPMVANTGAASDWDFTILDGTLQPILGLADHSPELQIANAPAWMCKSNGNLDLANHLGDFAAFSANLVRYYNKGGFTAGGRHFQSASANPVVWWGIFNEFNGNGLSAADYVKLYNAVVPAMLAVDPTIKLSAFEFSDYGLGSGGAGDPMQFVPAFVAAAGAGGVTAQVDAMSTHFYSSCNQKDSDATLFGTVPQFAANVQYFYRELATRADLAGVPVWVTENNVNADWSNNGMSICNPAQVFVSDPRGTSAFFAAWRPYVFAQLGKAGNRALFHWAYNSDKQYGEVDGSGTPYLSYWVDRTLEQLYPSTAAAPGAQILQLSTTDDMSVETLATRNPNGTVTVMVVDRAVHAAADNNGSGDPRTVVVDTSNLGSFAAASVLTIDAGTNVANGPTGVGVPPSTRLNVTLNGYGVAFVSLMP